jgi:hypothetical protein
VPGRLGLGACAKRFMRKERERSEKGARKGINANRASRICGERTLLIERLSI